MGLTQMHSKRNGEMLCT